MSLNPTVCFLPILAGAVSTAAAESATPSATVRIKTSKVRYLRGEPVLVTVTITNDGKKDIPAWIDMVKYAVTFFVKHDGNEFRKVNVYGGSDLKLDRYVDPLPPGQSKSYEFRILPIYERGKASALAFDKPGTYHVKVRYPLWKTTVKFESNTIQVRIQKPTGVDAKAWAEMDRPHFLRFLQSGVALRDKGEYPPITAARLLKEYPGSRYRPVLHWALSDFTRRRPGFWFKDKHLKPADVKLIKEALAAGGKVETSQISPAVGIAMGLLLASAVTILLVRKRQRA